MHYYPIPIFVMGNEELVGFFANFSYLPENLITLLNTSINTCCQAPLSPTVKLYNFLPPEEGIYYLKAMPIETYKALDPSFSWADLLSSFNFYNPPLSPVRAFMHGVADHHLN